MSLRNHLVDTTPLRVSRDFRWLYIGRTGLLLGAMLTETALIWQIYKISGSNLAVGAAAAAGGIGIVAGLLVGGILADRYDRRRILLTVRVPGLLVALALLVNALQDEPLLWFLFAPSSSTPSSPDSASPPRSRPSPPSSARRTSPAPRRSTGSRASSRASPVRRSRAW